MPFYLIDRVSNQIKASYARLSDVATQGFRVIDVPENLAIDEGVDGFGAVNLRDQKFAALLASAPRYSNVWFDDLASESVWDLTDPDIRAGVGAYTAYVERYDGDLAVPGRLQTDTIDVSAGGVFDDFAVYWDLYRLTRTGTRTTQVAYERVDPDLVDAFISNDDGATYTQVSHLIPSTLAGLGNQLRVRFENTSLSQRYYLGSVAVLY